MFRLNCRFLAGGVLEQGCDNIKTMEEQTNQTNLNSDNTSAKTEPLPSQSTPNRFTTAVLVVLLIITLAISVVLYFQNLQLKEELNALNLSSILPTPETPLSTPNTEGIPVVNDIGILKNNYIGVQLEYPDSWTVIDNLEEPLTSYVASLGTPPNKEYMHETEAFINIQLLEPIDSSFPTLESAVEGRRQYVGATSPEKYTAGNVDGFLIEAEGDSGGHREFIFSTQKHYVGIIYPKNTTHQEAIEGILSTLQLTN